MSEVLLCTGVVEQIRSVISQNRDARWIDVRPNGKPPSTIVSDVFVAVHGEGSEFVGQAGGGADPTRSVGRGLDNGFSEEFHIHVTVSVKLAQAHTDFWGPTLNMSWDKSLNYAVRQIANAVHCQPDVIAMANAHLDQLTESPFVEILKIIRIQPKKEQTTEWWGTHTTAESKRTNPVFGYSQTLQFFGGKRIQAIGSFT